MSKTNLSDIFSNLNTESSVILPKSIKIKNIKNLDIISDATSSFMPQKGGYSDATSSFMPQKGGYSDATSSFMPQKRGYLNGTKNKDINQLISMLSATSDDNYTANSTDNTEQLKNKLFNIIQSGGGDYNYFKTCIDTIFSDEFLEIKDDIAYAIKYNELDGNDKLMLQDYYRQMHTTHISKYAQLHPQQYSQVIKYGLQFSADEFPKIGKCHKFQPFSYKPPTEDAEDDYVLNIIESIMVDAYNKKNKTIIKQKLRKYQIFCEILKIIESNK